jgi:hypothetical protein
MAVLVNRIMRKPLTSAPLWYISYHVVDNQPRGKEKERKKCMEVSQERGRGDVW